MKVHLGYEVGTGAAVEIPLGHLVVSGQTQLSGKTTTLEAIVSRSGLRAIAFVTKRGEGSFARAREIPPFYRSPKSGVMWQYVSEVLQAKLGEKMKFERSWIMRVSRGAANLWDVHKNVEHQLEKGKLRELDRSVYEQLDAYFELVLPELHQLLGDPAHIPSFYLHDGINVMRLDGFSAETQMLCVASVLEYVYQNEEGVITIVPEAWEMVPQGRNTPVKAAAATMFRKGAALKNFVWFDSQDLAGVDKQALKQVSVWILGVQREENEARRMIEHLDVGGPKPKLSDVRTLDIGEFFVSFGKQLKKVYVQPAGVPFELAHEHAKHGGTEYFNEILGYMKKSKDVADRSRSSDGKEHLPSKQKVAGSNPAGSSNGQQVDQQEEEAMYKEKYEGLVQEVSGLRDLLKSYEKLLREHNIPGFTPTPGKRESAKVQSSSAAAPARTAEVETAAIQNGRRREWSAEESFDNESLYQAFKARLLEEAPAALLQIVRTRPEIEVSVKRETITMDTNNAVGRVALLIADGFFDVNRINSEVMNELSRRGFPTLAPNIKTAFDKLNEMGFLISAGKGRYRAVPEMKVNVVNK